MWQELIHAIKDNKRKKAAELIQQLDEKELDRKDENGATALIHAAYFYMSNLCELLIPKMSLAAINAVNSDGETALHIAASIGMHKVCKLLIPLMTIDNINKANIRGITPFKSAIEKDLEKVCVLMIPKIDLNAIVDSAGHTAMTLASARGMYWVCNSIIEKNPDSIYAFNLEGKSALQLAARSGRSVIVELLIPLMPDDAISSRYDEYNDTLLHYAATHGSEEICKILLSRVPAIINATNIHGDTALHLAAFYGKAKVCKLLLPNMGSDSIPAVNLEGKSALQLAAYAGRREIIELLIPLMPDDAISSRYNEYNNTLLHYAATHGSEEICKMLLSRIPDIINATNIHGDTALHLAAFYGKAKVCKLLLPNMGSDSIPAVNLKGNTALHLAASNGNKEVCMLLLQKNPNIINASNNHGDTALHLAAKNGYLYVCKLLISKMEVIDAVDNDNQTALHYAVLYDWLDVCKVLLDKMSNDAINTVNKSGDTALHVAIKSNNVEACKLLMQYIQADKIIELLHNNIDDSSIQNFIGKIIADFIKEKFSNSEIAKIDINIYQAKLLKISQILDQDLLKSHLNNDQCIINVNNYIKKNYFDLISEFTPISEDNPLSMLINSDCMTQILSYLQPHSLSPELFASVEMSGKDAELNS
jgi:ankyrin repeat protein